MEVKSFGKKSISYVLMMIFIVSACTPSDMPSRSLDQNNVTKDGTTAGIGNGASNNSGGIGGGTSLPPKVEIRHLIEPNLSTDPTYSPGTGHAGGGSYVRKLTLPKNFQGRLYVAGINIGSLSDRHVKVRFRFGVSRTPITIPALVTQAPGITPQTNIHVLVLDLRSEPFRNVRLPYDLFDYNEYSDSDTPVQDNRNTGLYCRGLKIEDDHTFAGVGACDGLQTNSSQPEEECLYAYAKILDQGLVKGVMNGSTELLVPLTPTLPNVKSITGPAYYQDYLSEHLKKPLPDTMPTYSTNIIGSYKVSELAVPANVTDALNLNFTYSPASPLSIWNPLSINGSNYYYRGPYRLINGQEWNFRFTELDGPKRLFRSGSWVDYPLYLAKPLPDDNQAQPVQNRIYYNSYLFPLATKLNLSANVAHLASDLVFDDRTEKVLPVGGETVWMDGVNARAQSRNSDQEHIGSCNISSSIEILAKDDNQVEYVIAKAIDVKIQLVRPTHHRTDLGNEVLFTNFKSCSTNPGNTSCSSTECCFNNRCWDENLVSQCYDSSHVQGNRNIGQNCATDFDCTSLCCNRVSGQCAPHNTLISPPVLCSKPVGDFCLAKEWCQKTPVVKCLVIKTGTDPLGNLTCRQHCYNTHEYGDCKAGVCIPPPQDPIPVFDPSDPSACAGAVPAPNFSGG